MFGRIVFAIFIVVPLIEIGLFAWLGQTIGVWPTLGGVVITAIVGSLLLRWQGFAVVRQLQATVSRGELPARQVADALLIGLGAILLLLPGYFTDLLGLLLFIPFVRSGLYAFIARRIKIVSPARASAEEPQVVQLDQSNWRER